MPLDDSYTFRCHCGYVTHDINAVDHLGVDGGCCNCGGQLCMECVTRTYHDRCLHDCLECADGEPHRIGSDWCCS